MFSFFKKIFSSKIDEDKNINKPDELKKLDEEIEEIEKDIEQEKPKKKNIFKRKEKLETPTTEDLQLKRKKVAKKIGWGSVFAMILFMAIAAAVIVAIRYMSPHKNRVNASSKNKEPSLEITQNKLWKLSVDNSIKNIKSQMAALRKETKKELNSTKTQITHNLEQISQRLIQKMSTMEQSIKQELANTKSEFKQELSETRRELKAYTTNKVAALAGTVEKKIKNISVQKQEEVPEISSLKLPQLPPLQTPRKSVKKETHLALPKPGTKEASMFVQEEKMEKNITKPSPEEEAAKIESNYIMADVEPVAKDTSIEYENRFNQKKAKKKEPSLHLMTGMVKATLITGVSAPTFSSGVTEPKPVLLSVDSDMVIANNDYESIKDCFLIGKATGNMNSERAEILISRISCSVTKGGKKYRIEEATPTMGWVIGEDGKYGVKGRLVDSAGKVVMNQLTIGFLQGVASAFSYANTNPYYGIGTTNGTSTNGVNANTLSTGVNNGLSTGAGNALSSLADYYKKMLDGIYPVIDVRAGRRVTVLFKGFQDVKEAEYKRIDVASDEEDLDIYEEVEVDYNGF